MKKDTQCVHSGTHHFATAEFDRFGIEDPGDIEADIDQALK